MSHYQIIAVITPVAARSMRRWFLHLGGVGFIPLGLLDGSVIPLPGSMDVLIILLAARGPQLWFYYALMATFGSVLGSFVTYRIARKGGKEAVARRVPLALLNRAYKIFERWGFGAIAIPAMLPPPTPMIAFVLAAGAMQYSAAKFLFALALGRFVRFTLLAYLAVRYGRRILTTIAAHGHLVLWAVVAVVGISVAVFLVMRARGSKKAAA